MKPYEAPEIQEKLARIKNAVLSVVPDTEAIYLFGSYVNGVPNEDSSLDIFVVVPDRNISEIELIWLISERIRTGQDVFLDFELLLNYSKSFRRNLKYPSFDRVAATTGVKIYG